MRSKRWSLRAALLVALLLPLSAIAQVARAPAGVIGENLEAWAEGMIETTYILNPSLESYQLEVAVENHVATLSGRVESIAEKRLAERIAYRTDGIYSVDNQIRVDPTLARISGDYPTPYAQVIADETISAMIESKLLWNSHIDGGDIDVAVAGRIVSLSGQADTPHARQLAGILAMATPGVIAVYNHLELDQVGTPTALHGVPTMMRDEWIHGRVVRVLDWTRGVDLADVSVTVGQGVVYLRGQADSRTLRLRAIDAAQQVPGVVAVDASELQLAGLNDAVAAQE